MGATRQWQIRSPSEHTVRVQYALRTDRVILHLDDVRIPVERVSGDNHFDDTCDYQFSIDNVPCRLSLNVHKFCRLWIGNELQPDPIAI
jgi:hypothetical protein